MVGEGRWGCGWWRGAGGAAGGRELETGVVSVAEFTKEEFPKLKADSVRDPGFRVLPT